MAPVFGWCSRLRDDRVIGLFTTEHTEVTEKGRSRGWSQGDGKRVQVLDEHEEGMGSRRP